MYQIVDVITGHIYCGGILKQYPYIHEISKFTKYHEASCVAIDYQQQYPDTIIEVRLYYKGEN